MKKFIVCVFMILAPVLFFEADVVIDGFEGEKTDWKGNAFISSQDGMEESAEEKILAEVSTKEAFAGKQSLRIEYIMSPVKANKFAQVSAYLSGKSMGENSAISLYVKAEGAKTAITVSLFDDKWKKWVSKDITVGTAGWQNIVLKASDLTGDANASWAKISKIQIVMKGSGVVYLDEVKFIK